MTLFCSRCGNRLFRENTQDGPEYVCVAGYRFSALPLTKPPLLGERARFSGGVRL